MAKRGCNFAISISKPFFSCIFRRTKHLRPPSWVIRRIPGLPAPSVHQYFALVILLHDLDWIAWLPPAGLVFT
jgi:hypothetical protein